MKKRTDFAILILLPVFMSSCATVPTIYDTQKSQGQWEAKAQIRDLERGKNSHVSLDVRAEKDRALRMEVSGPMGISVASLLLKSSEISYAVHTQKKFYSGEVSENSLAPLFNVPLDPRWLFNVFFDEPIPQKNWSCEIGADSLVEKCLRLSDETSILWSERKGEGKRVTIANKRFEVQVLVKGFQPKVQSPEKAFSLNPPDSYKRYKLQ